VTDAALPGPTIGLPGGGAMPLLGFGTWQLQGREAYDAVRSALDVGYRHLDTATIYRNEAEVGRAIRDSGVPRTEVFVTTKLPPQRAGAERATLERSLADLGVDAVDLWLVHWPPHRGAGTSTWEAFLDLQREGLVREIGVSNYDLDLVDELVGATGTAPAVDQVRWGPSLHDPRFAAGLAERGVVLEGYSPFKSTRLRDPVLGRIARSHGVTPTQVVVRWHLQHGFVVIPKSARPERIAANADVFGFALSDDEMAAIDGMGG
jgi:2,5-diketo-D-gluconate reductase A